MISQQTKRCRVCLGDKDLSEFYKNKTCKGGLDTKCKSCSRRIITERRNTRPEHYAAYDLARFSNPLRKQQIRKSRPKSKARWNVENPEKLSAHQALYYAISTGKVKRQPCERCGSTVHVHGHHENYDFPLDVIWLCVKHHRIRHKELNLTHPRKVTTP